MEGNESAPESTEPGKESRAVESETPIEMVDAVVQHDKTTEFLYRLLESEEYASLADDVRKKIESAVQEKINVFLVQEALHLSSKSEYEKAAQTLHTELDAHLSQIEELRYKLDGTSTELALVKSQLLNAEDEVKKANESQKKMRYEWQDFKTQRDLACDEKESLLTMIERRNAELLVLREEKAEMAKKLESAVKSKMAATENSQEVESLRISLEYKEKRLEQEANLLKTQVETLSYELEEKSDELINLRRSMATSAVANESELASKTEELRIALENLADLRETNETLKNRAEELLEKLSSQRDSYDVMMENFHQELSSQTKLAQLYKGMCTENESKTEKLTDSIQELRKLLAEATKRYGDLETKQREKVIKLEEEISKRDECIQHLKRELQDANKLLEVAKQENVDAAIGSLSPSAAAASRLIKSGMTLTQIYTQYARVSEELLLEKEETRRLNLYVTTIVNEIEEKAPILYQQRLDYEKAVAAVESLTQEMDRMIAESQMLSGECTEAKKISNHLSRENQRLKKELQDLARQVCYLVKAVEEARGGMVSHDTVYEVGSGGSAQDIISKHLVTFASIEDLQENNQKLLALVRQLSEKQEAVESVSAQEYHEIKSKKDQLEQRMTELVEEMGRQSKMLDLVRTQSASYRKLYQQSMGGDPEAPATPPQKTSPDPVTSTPVPPSRSQPDEELGKKLLEAKETIKALEEEVNSLKKNIRDKEQEMHGKIEKLNSEVRDWMYKNSKLVAQAEYNEEKSKVLEANLKTTKKQVAALEERNRTVSEISAKHEQSLVILKDQAMDAQSKLARAQVQRDNLQQEVLLLKTAEARLTKERESLNRERINNSALMNNLDGLKAALDRSEAEGKLRLEVQLSEALKECSALRSSLRDEKDRFKELASSLERQTNLAKERMMEEKTLADKARTDLDVVKNELETKGQLILQLNNKIRELSNQPVRNVIQTVSSNLDASTKRVKDLEKQVRDLENEMARLKIQLNSAVSGSKQYAEMAETSETHLQKLVKEHHNCSNILATKEKEWAARVKEVEMKLEDVQKERNRLLSESESRVQSTVDNVQEISSALNTVKSELEAKESDLANTRKEVETLTQELTDAKEQINLAKQQVVETEARYTQEVVYHSQAIQALDTVQKQMAIMSDDHTKLQRERDDALSALAAKTTAWDEQKKGTDAEMVHLTERLKDLDEQNCILHDTLEKLNTELAIMQAKISEDGEQSDLEISLNTSSVLSNTAHEQLVKVIKFLRQEKDIATTRSEVLQAENTRLKAQVAMLQRQLAETNSTVSKLKETSDVSEKTSTKHAELLRKVESLNAVTDSNRLLREERNRFKTELLQSTEKLIQAEASVAPLRAEVAQLKANIETLTTENQAFAGEVSRWKARATQLSTKASPEDWRRLSSERENFYKQWHAEKTNNEKLEESLKKLRQENVGLTEQIAEIRKQLHTESVEVRRLNEEVNATKQKLSQAEQELNIVRAQVKKLTDDVTKATEDATSKESTLTDLRAKEAQIRKIAKKYKMQYEALVQKTNEENKKRAEEDAKKLEEAQKPLVIPDDEQERLRAEGRAQISSQLTELEGRMTDRMKELQNQVAVAVEEAETVKKDNEALKTSINEKEERAKQVIKTARNKIALLTEQKTSLEQELSQTRGHADQSRDEHDSKLNALKSNYDAVIARMEKERAEQAELANQERERMASQMKALNQRINQMQRSLDKPKPSTSSQPVPKSTMEPPTANIKPMAGSSTARKQKQTPAQQLVGPYWAGGNETPFASIRPVQTRTLAVQPTSLGGVAAGTSAATASSGSSALMVPLQQQVHTTGTSGEALSSSPTSSHTDYMPATSSATPIRVVVAPVPLNAQSSQEAEVENEPVGPLPQTVAMVVPRVEAAAGSPAPGPSSSGANSTSSQASSSNTVTTTQAGHKRPRDIEGDSSTNTEGDHVKSSPQIKRKRVSGSGQSEVFHHQVTHSEGSEVEYQVPTSSQRDQEDDMVIMLVDSEDDGNADEGEAEEPDDGFEEEDNGESYEAESYSRDGQDMGTFEEGTDIDEDNAADGSNEVEIIEDSNEVPAAVPVGQEQQQQSSEATSSGNDNNSDHVVVSHAASSQSFRTRSVPPLNRAQPSLQSYEEGGDDSIVPSTPTLFLPRRVEGFGEAVSSPQVPHQRFTFSEPSPGTSRRDEAGGDDPGTGRSVPTTPLVASPQEVCPDQAEPSISATVPHIPSSISEEDMPLPDPSVAPGDEDLRGQEDTEEPETVIVEEDSDGVTSEGEKPPAVGGELMEEGREAEASEPIARIGGTARRSGRPSYPRRGPSRRPTPIVWNEPGSSGLPSNQRATGRGVIRGRGSRRNWQ